MRFIDTHTHQYQPKFDSDRHESIERCLESGVDTLLLPNIDVESIPRVLSMMEKWPDMCFGMMGLHPCHVDGDFESTLETILKTLDNPPSGKNFIAVGEIGIDLYWAKTHIEQQKLAFMEQCSWAKERSLPIVIHVRNAWEELFEVLDKVNDSSLTGVFHCFTGGEAEAKRALEYGGFKLGIGGVVTYKNGGLDKVLPGVGVEHLVLETDSPYLSPVPFRGKRNESSYVKHVAERVAAILDLTTDEVAQKTTENAVNLFNLKK
ncbi:MAG: hydrolase TatD [Crocinitomicaceae bacterium]|nr:hydrolase TatD [Crocinitomicaceae bacterium]|tara:strand:- start:837 stop:1625 length:789 start_codon:yes stop_codon:yes gene_type:complete